MGTRLRIYLTREEDRTLFELRSAKGSRGELPRFGVKM